VIKIFLQTFNFLITRHIIDDSNRSRPPSIKIDELVVANGTVFSFIIIILLRVYENDLMVCSIIEQNTKISYIAHKIVKNL